MKTILTLGVLGLLTSVAGAAPCDEAAATTAGRSIANHIADINHFKKAGKTRPVVSDENYFYVTTVYDLGLSVPKYTVKMTKSSCFVTDVEYGNEEG